MQNHNPAGTNIDAEKLPESCDADTRLARAIGDGDAPFPSDLSASQIRDLANLVREHRRVAFLQFLARQVAQDLTNSTLQRNEEITSDA